MERSGQAKLHCLRLVLPLLMGILLTSCSNRVVEYKVTCAQQTQQFMDNIHSVVVNELNPVIKDGFKSGPSAEITERIEKLDARVSKINTPKCNPRAPAVKEALRQYMLETKKYFETVAGRAVYGEGSVQGQLSKMSDAGWAFEVALEDLRK